MEEYREDVVATRGRLGARLWYIIQPLRFVDAAKLGLILGAGFGVWNLIATQLDPLAEDTPIALLTFYGPMFALWGIAGFGATRRSGHLFDAVKVGAAVALVTFVVYVLTQFVRVNLFLEILSQRSDWQNLMASFQNSGYASLRSYANYVGLAGAPLKILVASIIGACTGAIGGSLALGRSKVGPTLR